MCIRQLLLFIITIILCTNYVFTQEIDYKDHIYVNNLKSVAFHIEGLPTSNPIINLNSTGVLTLSFDDMDGGSKDYYYEIIHCDKNWEPSDLNQIEYLDGFARERIRDFEFSRNTYIDYSNYHLEIPNRFMNWKISGNYLLIIRDSNEELMITRRFVVVEPLLKLDFQVFRAKNALRFDTDHELFFEIDLEDKNIYRPAQEIEAIFLQNGRWDNAIGPLAPRSVRGKRVQFNYINELYFPAGNEFRGANLTTYRTLQMGVAEIEFDNNLMQFYLEPDQTLSHDYNFIVSDLNGKFVIDAKIGAPDLRAEYAKVLFSLESEQLQNSEVYVVGHHTSWGIESQFKMDYSVKSNAYILNTFLKQGYYDYSYWVVSEDGKIDKNYFQGNFNRTSNEYTALVYYRDFSERYDRIIGIASIYRRGF